LEPLSPLTLELDPDLPRGQVLVTGHDLDKQSVRSFYLERMEQIETLSLRDEFEQRGGEDRATGENAGKCFLPLARTWRRMTSWLRRTCDCRQPGA
jgi:predicted DNA-binding transcriptional regulator YafY